MKSKYNELALYGSQNLCARTDTVFLPISEVCDGMVSLGENLWTQSLATLYLPDWLVCHWLAQVM